MFRLNAEKMPKCALRLPLGADVIVLGGRVAMGKTAFALDVASRLAAANKKVAIFTPESCKEQIFQRLNSRMHTSGHENIAVWTKEKLTVEELRSKLAAGKVDFVVVDCLQNFETKTSAQTETVMWEIRQLAKDLDLTVLVLSQLSRDVEYRRGHIPRVKDIPHYKKVVPFAKQIFLLYREAYYYLGADRRSAWCFIGNGVRGKAGAAKLTWNDEKLGFDDLEF